MAGRQAPAGDDWIGDAVARYQGPLIAYAARLLNGSVDRGRDVAQETFLRLCRQPREDVEDRLPEWLFAVCRNLAIDIRRKDGRMTALPDTFERTDPAPRPAERLEQSESAAHILRLIDALPENQQDVIVLKFQHGLSYKEIAGVTRLSVSNVGFLIHTGLKTLRQRMGLAQPITSIAAARETR